jgi:hypothetical protein
MCMTGTEADELVEKLAATQHGGFTSAQARAAGMTASAVRHRIASGRWLPLRRGVYRLRGAPLTWELRLFAAVAGAGGGAVASHRAAAQLFGIPGFDGNWVEVTARRGARAPFAQVRIHSTRQLPKHHVKVIRSIQTTSVARTLFDLAGVLHPGRVERALDNCLARKLVTPEATWRVFQDLATSGRAGVRVFGELLVARGDGYVAPASELERMFLDIVIAAHLPLPERELNLGDGDSWIGRVEFVYPHAKLLIEIDGRMYHTALLDQKHDKNRRNRFNAAGWRVLQIDYEMLIQRPHHVAELVRSALLAAV